MRKAFFVVLGFICTSLVHADVLPKIINGTPASTQTYPWMVNYNGCGGTLIAPQWILTAGHCFNTEDNQSVSTATDALSPVTLFSDNISVLGAQAKQINIIQVIPHPDYNPALGFNNDITLLKLAEAVPNAPVVTLMSEPNVSASNQFIAMGWGATRINEMNKSVDPSDILLQTPLFLTASAACKAVYAKDGSDITDNMICFDGAANKNLSDTCQGDSGGPVVMKTSTGFTQVGITSFGGIPDSAPCAAPNVPGIYTRVARYQNWIKSHVPEARFSSSTCNTSMDANLNLDLPCLIYQNNVYSTRLAMINNTALIWEWDGSIKNSQCPLNTNTCVTVGNDLSLQIHALNIGGQNYKAKLNYAPAQHPNDWTYAGHSPE
jgi:secreted trypsin-like serine protease